MTETKQTIYIEGIDQVGVTHEKWIADSNVALELATLEENKGRKVALTREKELAEGLTETQKENLKAVMGLGERFPHAFLGGIHVDTLGRPFLITKETEQAPTVVIGQEGAAILTRVDRRSYNSRQVLESLRLDENSDSLPHIGRMMAEMRNRSPIGAPGTISYTERGGISGDYTIATVNGEIFGKQYNWASVREAAPVVGDWLKSINNAHQDDPATIKPVEDILDLF